MFAAVFVRYKALSGLVCCTEVHSVKEDVAVPINIAKYVQYWKHRVGLLFHQLHLANVHLGYFCGVASGDLRSQALHA